MERYSNYLKVVLFLSILIFMIMGLSYIFEPKNNMKSFGMSQETTMGFLGEKKDTIDVLFIGDSLAYSSFIPMQLYQDYGFTSYNLGTSRQKMYETYNYLKAFLDKQSPKVIVLETNALLRWWDVNKAITEEISNYWPILQYHDRWKSLSINDITMKVSYTYINPDKGYILRKDKSSIENCDYMKKSSNYLKISKRNMYYFQKIINLVNKKDIPLLMVSTASLENMTYDKHNTYEKLAKEYNLDYIDLNLVEQVNIDWQADTYDKGDHLNENGAKKVTAYMGAFLKDKYNLVNHKQDINYQMWNLYT